MVAKPFCAPSSSLRRQISHNYVCPRKSLGWQPSVSGEPVDTWAQMCSNTPAAAHLKVAGAELGSEICATPSQGHGLEEACNMRGW